MPGRPSGAELDAGDEAHRRICHSLTVALVGPPHALGEALAEDAVGDCPAYSFSSRLEAFEAMSDGGDSLAVHHLHVQRLWWFDPVAVAQWFLVARVDVPLLAGDDVLVEPTDRLVTLEGVTIAELAGDRITSLHTTFDDGALIEQVLLSAAP